MKCVNAGRAARAALALWVAFPGCCRPVDLETSLGTIEMEDEAGCRDTALLVTFRLPAGTTVDAVTLSIEGARSGGPWLLERGGAPLEESETVLLRLAATAVAEVVVSASASPSDGGEPLRAARTVNLVPGLVTGVALELSACEAADGRFCDTTTGESVSCDAAGSTVRTDCAPFGCNLGTDDCNACVPGMRGCDGGAVIDCTAEGRPELVEACAFDCLDGACVDCVPGGIACQGDLLVTCAAAGTVVASDPCDPAYGCNDGASPARCNLCTPGVVHCIGNDRVDCDADGLVAAADACPYGCDPVLAACRACTPGAIECQGSSLVECSTTGMVLAVTDCSAYGCQTGTDPDQCNACFPGATQQCIGDSAISCNAIGIITSSSACPSGCNVATGTCNSCVPDTDFCTASGDIGHCDATGSVASVDACAYGCSSASGAPQCNACTPSSTACQGAELVACDSLGAIVTSTPCAYGCNTVVIPSQCNECVPSTTECQGSSLVACSSLGFITTVMPCPAGCSMGACN